MVVGLKIVSWGVSTLGVSGPKTAMELGQKTCLTSSARAASRTLNRPLILTSQALAGFFSPVADRIAAK